MPGYKGHLVGGVVSYGCLFLLVYNQHTDCATALSWFAMCCAGALFPDIDIKSKGQKYFYWVLLGLLVWSIVRCKTVNTPSRFNVVASLAILSCLPMLIRHRGITHEPLFIIACAAGCWYFISSLYPSYTEILFFHALFFTVGALSHIWLDKGFIKKRKK